jgi:hypothetical protein
MYDSAFPDQTLNALRLPPAARPVTRGLFSGMGSALSASVPVAFFETARAVEGLRSAAGLPSGDTLESAMLGMPSLSESIWRDIKRFTPDPETIGEVSNVVFTMGKVLTKAAAFGAMGGLPVAAVGTGAVEGTAEAQRLGDQGVDPATAAKVGAVRGATTAAGIALPIAGKTLAQTAALAITGGPASFMVEQQASKMILDAANYKDIARQYNPFDPVGLTVSALIPGVIGGVVHAGRARRARVDTAAKVEADRVVQETAAAEQKTMDDALLAANATREEAEAAARSLQTADHIQTTGLYPRDSVAGAAAHVDALELAKRQLDAGEPVTAADVIARVQEMEAARVRAEDTPGFLRTADDMVALRQTEYPHLTPDLDRAIEIARTPGAFRSAEDKIFLEGMIREGKDKPVVKAPDVETAPARTDPESVAQPAKAEPQKQASEQPAAKTQEPDSTEVSARQIAEKQPDLMVVDEFTGQVTSAAKLLDDAEAVYQKDVKDSDAFMAAITCFVRH